jgi:hypothetical protein
MYKHKQAIMRTVQRFVPEHKKSAVLAKRFAEQGESYFLFVEDLSIAPTNNFAEQGIRTLVLDRIVTQGVRSECGNEWAERFWTTIATCRRLGMNVLSFLRESIYAVAHGLSPPSFLPQIAEKIAER